MNVKEPFIGRRLNRFYFGLILIKNRLIGSSPNSIECGFFIVVIVNVFFSHFKVKIEKEERERKKTRAGKFFSSIDECLLPYERQ